MVYRVVVPKNVQKNLDKIEPRYRKRIVIALVQLSSNPELGKKLKGKLGTERSYVVWPYRIIYRIERNQLVVLIIKIGHRQGVCS
mgnify:CR=1 FL=1